MTNMQKFVLLFIGIMSAFLVECCKGAQTV